MNQAIPATTLAVAMAGLLSGCLVEELESGLVIVNESGRRLTVAGQVVPRAGDPTILTSGGACGGPGVTALDSRGDVFATLDSEWCPEDVWTIGVGGESTLTRAENS